MKKFNYNKLLKLLEFNDCQTIVFVDGQGMFSYSTLSHFIDAVRLDTSNIDEINTYNISNVSIQKSLFNDEKDILFVFLI